MPKSHSRFIAILALLRNLLFAALTYALVFGIIQIIKTPSQTKGKLGIPAILDKSGPAYILRTTKSGVQVKFAASSESVILNPHANVFNRPESAVVAKDDYLGSRPHVDSEINYNVIIDACRGTYLGTEKIKNVFECLEFLEKEQGKYLTLPAAAERASLRNPNNAEYKYSKSSKSSGSTGSDHYDTPESAIAPSITSIGTCAGPVIPYHIYWLGAATWRLEMFIKSYFYTQNLACSRLHIWLDQDRYPQAITHMLTKDPLFARFLAFVDRGDIILEGWKFPSKIPLPKNEDNTDGLGYYKTPQKPNSKGETAVADGIIEDSEGQQWLILSAKQLTLLPEAVSETVRFVILHLHGGVFFDVDVLLLRDMRPFVLPKNHSFAHRWASYPHPGDFSASVLSLTANSTLSSYLIRGGVRMGINFHSRVIGRMAWKDGRDQELIMFESAVFDPMWTEANWGREGKCTVPCLKDYSAVFKGKINTLKEEWDSYSGSQLAEIDLHNPPTLSQLLPHEQHEKNEKHEQQKPKDSIQQKRKQKISYRSTAPIDHTQSHLLLGRDEISSMEVEAAPPPSHFPAESLEELELRKAGAIADYQPEDDKFKPNNRTLEHFYRGAFAYNVHNSWLRHPEPSSWLSVIQRAHDGFFKGQRLNMYGERWEGPELMGYYYWPEYL